MATIQAFTGNDKVLKAIEKVKATCQGKEFSDLIDGAGRQYVDLVMEGGGVLGIALVGYTYVLEQAGIRFLGIAGTSAGAINALMIAALGPPEKEKSDRLLEMLTQMPMVSFIDGDPDARDFSHALLNKVGISKLLWKTLQIVDNLQDDLGLNPGNTFLDWLKEKLFEVNIYTTDQLMKQLSTVPAGLKLRETRANTKLTHEDQIGRLVMIAADVTTETKVDLPRMARLYWPDPLQINPAYFARASMSIPFFFHPFRVRGCSSDRNSWKDLAGYGGTPPHEVMFVDGGIMSNFPINVFHQEYNVPVAPTFGAKIGIEGQQPMIIDKPLRLLGAVFDAARHALDVDFIKRNPDYKHLVSMIDTGDHHWLNFAMKPEEQVDLFARGAMAAAEFLSAFDWEKYKNIRRGIQAAFKASS